MKYHIFGSIKGPYFKCKLKDDLASNPDDYDQCIEDYENIIKDSRYTDIYFVCDFGMYEQGLFEYTASYDNARVLPFMIVMEWHMDPNMHSGPVEEDSLLELKGFKETFKNNKAAIEKFLYYVESKIQAEFNYGTVDKKRYIADSRFVIVMKHPHVIKRFKFKKK